MQENHQENKVDIKEEIQSINIVRAKVIDLKAGKKKKRSKLCKTEIPKEENQNNRRCEIFLTYIYI